MRLARYRLRVVSLIHFVLSTCIVYFALSLCFGVMFMTSHPYFVRFSYTGSHRQLRRGAMKTTSRHGFRKGVGASSRDTALVSLLAFIWCYGCVFSFISALGSFMSSHFLLVSIFRHRIPSATPPRRHENHIPTRLSKGRRRLLPQHRLGGAPRRLGAVPRVGVEVAGRRANRGPEGSLAECRVTSFSLLFNYCFFLLDRKKVQNFSVVGNVPWVGQASDS